MVHVGYLTWSPLTQGSNLLCFFGGCFNGRAVQLSAYLLALSGGSDSMAFLKAQNHPSQNSRICFQRRQNYHPFTFSPFLQSSLYFMYNIASISGYSPVKLHALLLLASNLLLVFLPTNHCIHFFFFFFYRESLGRLVETLS